MRVHQGTFFLTACLGTVPLHSCRRTSAWLGWVDVAFARMDDNGDGFISLEEIMAKLPLVSTDPDDDVASTRLLDVRRTPFILNHCRRQPVAEALEPITEQVAAAIRSLGRAAPSKGYNT